MTTEEPQELPPESGDPPEEADLGRFDIVWRKKPYLIAESDDGYELWDERDLLGPIRLYELDEYPEAEADIRELARQYRQGPQVWFRWFCWLFGLSLAFVVVGSIAASLVEATGEEVSFELLVTLVQLIPFMFLGACLAWMASHRPDMLALKVRPGGRLSVRLITWTCVVGLAAWSLGTTAGWLLSIVIPWKPSSTSSGAFGDFPEPSLAVQLAYLVGGVGRTVAFVALASLILILLNRTLGGSSTPLVSSDDEIDQP